MGPQKHATLKRTKLLKQPNIFRDQTQDGQLDDELLRECDVILGFEMEQRFD